MLSITSDAPSQKQKRLQLITRFSFLALFIFNYFRTDNTAWLFPALAFLVWFFWGLRKPIVQTVVFAETEQGFISQKLRAGSEIKWQDVVALGLRENKDAPCVIVWRKDADETDRFVWLSKQDFSDDDFRKIIDLVELKCPNMPTYKGGKILQSDT